MGWDGMGWDGLGVGRIGVEMVLWCGVVWCVIEVWTYYSNKSSLLCVCLLGCFTRSLARSLKVLCQHNAKHMYVKTDYSLKVGHGMGWDGMGWVWGGLELRWCDGVVWCGVVCH